MKVFIQKPDISLHPGIVVDKDMVFEYKNDHVQQKLENLVLHSVTKVCGEGYESVYDTTICLEEGDVLIYEEEGRGYVKPVASFVTIEAAIDELTNIKDLG